MNNFLLSKGSKTQMYTFSDDSIVEAQIIIDIK
jgi:hypothetical protein